ncbi:hypothetical protein CYMTET_13431 [Cymbomonas tetramitiformis]|uniref:Transmembrane protein family 132 fourth domain-containing protein n=1 Tax=Cymbomonas tetramitiformis TaxID=36881 RepID=A0AAE0LB67_9CHLO|nr:hypothetical protein CYMTET_13431 [Cymbomonas tetramitiformis]
MTMPQSTTYVLMRVILGLLLCFGLPVHVDSHTTDVCWVWDSDGGGIRFYIATWHQEQECDIYDYNNAGNRLLCPMTVKNTAGYQENYAGARVYPDAALINKWYCRGYCDDRYEMKGRWPWQTSYQEASDRLSWFTFHVTVPCGQGLWYIEAPEHYMFDPLDSEPYHYCTIKSSTYNGATYGGQPYRWIGNNEGIKYSNPVYTWDSTPPPFPSAAITTAISSCSPPLTQPSPSPPPNMHVDQGELNTTLYFQGSNDTTCITLTPKENEVEQIVITTVSAPSDHNLTWTFDSVQELRDAGLCGFWPGSWTLDIRVETLNGTTTVYQSWDVFTGLAEYAQPTIRAGAGSPGYAAGPTVYQGESSFARTFTALNTDNAGAQGSVGIYMGGDACSNGVLLQSMAYTTVAEQAASVGVVLRTTSLYHDRRTLSLEYFLRDAAGRPQVLLDDLKIEMMVRHQLTFATFRVQCLAPDAASGTASCSFDDWHDSFFNSGVANATVTLYVNYAEVRVAESEPVDVLVQTQVQYDELTHAGMVLDIPASPRTPGTGFTAQLSANTDGYALSTWGVTILYDPAVLSFEEFEVDSRFLTPTVNSATAGQVRVVVAGLADGVETANVTGSAVSLAEAQFKVTSTAAAGEYAAALSCTITEMVTVTTLTLEGTVNVPAQVNDWRGGNRTEGSLLVEKLETVGLYGFASQAEIFNTARLTGEALATQVEFWAAHSSADSPDTMAAVSSCHVANMPEVATAEVSGSGCRVVVNASHTGGAAAVEILATAGDLSVKVPLRVWIPLSVEVTANDTLLSPVYGSMYDGGVPPNCPEAVYQSTGLQATAVFGGEGLDPLPELDVTCLVGLTSNDSTVLDVAGTRARGRSLGHAAVWAQRPGSSEELSQQMAMTVGGPAVSVHHLSAVLVTGAEVAGASTVGSGADARLTVDAQLQQKLTREGDEGSIYVYAALSDGSVQPIGAQDGVAVAVHADYTAMLSVRSGAGGSQAADFVAEVQRGATSASSEEMLQPTWAHPCSGQAIAAGSGEVSLDIQNPEAVTVTSSEARIARIGSPAASLGVATSATLTVTLHYRDGTSVDVSQSNRTNFTVIEGADLAQMEGNAVSSLSDGTGHGAVSVMVSFFEGDSASEMTDSVMLTLVIASELHLLTTPHPAYPAGAGYNASDSTSMTQFHQVMCTGVYQRGEVVLVVDFSDGQRSDVTAQGTLASSDPVGLAVEGVVLIPRAAGPYTVTGEFEGLTSTVPLSVMSTAVWVDWVEHTTAWSDETFHAVQNSTHDLSVRLGLSDGTVIEDAVGGPQSSWLQVESMLGFNTSQAAITVDQSAKATLSGNAVNEVVLTAAAKCTANASVEPATGEDRVFANLAPAAYDVDIGNEVQAALVLNMGGYVEVPVRVQTAGAGDTLNLFDILITFESAYIRAEACQVGSGWSGYSFTCTINDPVNEVLITGVEVETEASSLVEVAVLRFRALDSDGAAFTEVKSTVQALQTSGFRSTQAYPAVAAQVWCAITSRRRAELRRALLSPRRALLSPRRALQQEAIAAGASTRLEGAAAAAGAAGQPGPVLHTHRRQLHHGTVKDVMGDVNRDGIFDLFDILEVKSWVAGLPGYSMGEISNLTGFQRQQLDPTLDYLVDPEDTSNCPYGWTAGTPCPSPKDAQYLLYTYANYLRFVSLGTAGDLERMVHIPATLQDALTITVEILDKSSNPVVTNDTTMGFEIGLRGRNVDMVVVEGGNVEPTATQDGVMVTAARVYGTGKFTATMTGPLSNAGSWVYDRNVGVALLVQTYDSEGGTTEQRGFALAGSSLLGSQYTPLTTFDFQNAEPPSPPPPFPPGGTGGSKQAEMSGLVFAGFLGACMLLVLAILAYRRRKKNEEAEEPLLKERDSQNGMSVDMMDNPLAAFLNEDDKRKLLNQMDRGFLEEYLLAEAHGSISARRKSRVDKHVANPEDFYASLMKGKMNPMTSDITPGDSNWATLKKKMHILQATHNLVNVSSPRKRSVLTDEPENTKKVFANPLLGRPINQGGVEMSEMSTVAANAVVKTRGASSEAQCLDSNITLSPQELVPVSAKRESFIAMTDHADPHTPKPIMAGSSLTYMGQESLELQNMAPNQLLSEVLFSVETDMNELQNSMATLPEYQVNLISEQVAKGTTQLEAMIQAADLMGESASQYELDQFCSQASSVFASIQAAQQIADNWQTAKVRTQPSDLEKVKVRQVQEQDAIEDAMSMLWNIKRKLRKVTMAPTDKRPKATSSGSDLSGLSPDLARALAARRAAHKLAKRVRNKGSDGQSLSKK